MRSILGNVALDDFHPFGTLPVFMDDPNEFQQLLFTPGHVHACVAQGLGTPSVLLGSDDVLGGYHDFEVFVSRCAVVLFVLTCARITELFALQTNDLFSIFCGQIVGVCVCDSCGICARPL